MAILARDSGNTEFEKCPLGVWPAIAVDVIDLGEVETPFKWEKGPLAGQTKIQHQIQVVWQVDAETEDETPARREDGTMHRLSKFYNLTLNENATLRKDLDRWRGKPFTNEQLEQGWDVESIIGAQCQLNVVENDKGKVVVESVLPRGRRDPALEADEYQREMDRPGGRDTRSPAAEGQKTGGRGAVGKGKQERPAASDDEGDDDSFPLPF
jgi:hypothetical protein